MSNLLLRRNAMLWTGDSALYLKDLPLGTGVYFATRTYIYLGNYDGNPWMIREYTYGAAQKMRNSSTDAADYEGSIIDDYIVNQSLPTFSEQQRSVMADAKITIHYHNGTSRLSKTITRKAFLPPFDSGVANSGAFITALKAFYNTTSTNTSRKAMQQNTTTYRGWWTCDAASDASTMRVVFSTGANGTAAVNFGGTYYARPVFAFKPDTKVKLIDGVYTVVYD